MTLVTIAAIGQLIATLILPSIETALKLKALLELDPDFQVNVQRLTAETIAADDAAMEKINARRREKGLPEFPKE